MMVLLSTEGRSVIFLLLAQPTSFVKMSSSKTTVVSAPGKVLIAGGYLVLDPAYPGLVIATDSRFYTFITDEEDSNQVPQSTILVESPQFIGARWHYKVRKIDSRQEKTDWFVEQTR